jgi:hypothetical protein
MPRVAARRDATHFFAPVAVFNGYRNTTPGDGLEALYSSEDIEVCVMVRRLKKTAAAFYRSGRFVHGPN